MEVTMESLGTDLDWKKKLIFASVFIEANKMQTVFDNYHNEITSKQWLLLVIASSFQEPPTLTAVGEQMGCSRQNVKKIATLLEKKEFIRLYHDDKDKRSLRIEITHVAKAFFQKQNKATEGVFEQLFSAFTEDEINQFFEGILKLSKGIDLMGEYFENQKNT